MFGKIVLLMSGEMIGDDGCRENGLSELCIMSVDQGESLSCYKFLKVVISDSCVSKLSYHHFCVCTHINTHTQRLRFREKN